MKHTSGILLIFCILLMLTVPAFVTTNAQTSTQEAPLSVTSTPNSSPTDFFNYESLIRENLQSNPAVQLVEVTDNRSEKGGIRTITITYDTQAIASKERVDEWMSILIPIADSIAVHGLDVDQVALIGTSADETVGNFYVQVKDLMSYRDKKLTRAQLLGKAKYVSLQPTPTFAPTNTPVPTIAVEVGTRDNPVRQGRSYSFPGLARLTVKSQWSRGQTGLAIVLITITCERPKSQKCDTTNFMLTAVGESGKTYDQAFESGIPEPSFGLFGTGDVYGGGTASGYVGFSIGNRETSLQMRVSIFLEGREVFFDIS